MKTIILFFLALTLTLLGFSQSRNKGTIVEKAFTYENWGIPVYCNGTEVGGLEGDVTMTSVIHNNKSWTLDIVSGVLEGTGDLAGEYFEIKFHGKYFFEDGFRVELHFIAKGDKGTKIINRGYFTPITGPVSLKSKCF